MRPEAAGGKIRCEATLERELRARGFHAVAGVDEVGRGTLFGAVFAAAVEGYVHDLGRRARVDGAKGHEQAGKPRESKKSIKRHARLLAPPRKRASSRRSSQWRMKA